MVRNSYTAINIEKKNKTNDSGKKLKINSLKNVKKM
jgi:hypothetical protein